MPSQVSNTKRVNESAAFLLLFSFFALIEGIIRMTSNSKPSLDVDYYDDADGTQIPVIFFLVGGVAEVLFGMSGIFVAFFQLFFGKGSPNTTLYFVNMQAILGWFVFIVYVIAAPIKAAMKAEGVPGVLSQSEARALIILGNLLGSVTFCWALQGGQFIMALRLLAAQKGEEESQSKNVVRAMVWSSNQIVSAVSTLYVGILLAARDFESTTAPVGAPPHVVWFPSISIVTGLVMLVYGVVSLLATKNKHLATTAMPRLWVVTTVAMMINFSWVFGIVPGLAPPIPGAAQHAGLVLSVTILPLFHVWRTHFPIDEDVGKVDMTMTPSMVKQIPEQALLQQTIENELTESAA